MKILRVKLQILRAQLKVKGEKSLAVSKIQLSIVVFVSEEPWWEVRGAGAGGGPRQGPGLRRRGRLHGVHPAVSTEYTYMEYTVLSTGVHITFTLSTPLL